MSLEVNSMFKLLRNFDLGGEDYVTLSQMYMPIMGVDSFSLYIYMANLRDSSSYQFKKLIDSLNLNSPKFIEKAISKLEALSLVDLFYNEQKGYIINLNRPMCRTSFLENVILSSFLRSQIGEVEFEKIKNFNSDISFRGYKNITKSFDDVFEIKESNVVNIFSKIFKYKTKKNIKVNNPNFDYIFFKMNFDTTYIDSKILDDEQFKSEILSISFNYQLNEEEMKEVIINTIELDKDLKYEDISKNARIFYQKKNRNKKKTFVTKESDAFVNSALDDETFHFVEKLEKLSPAELLEEINGGISPSTSEIKLLEDLQNNTNFPLSVINLMVLFINEEKQGVLPTYNYFEKIANTWARAGIKNAVDALNYINNYNLAKETKKPRKYTSSKKEAPLPDWYDSYEEQLKKLPKQEELSQEEIDKILSDFIGEDE